MNVRLYLGSTESIKQFLRNSSTMGIISLQAMLKELREGEFKIIDINGLQIKKTFLFCACSGTGGSSGCQFYPFCTKLFEVA